MFLGKGHRGLVVVTPYAGMDVPKYLRSPSTAVRPLGVEMRTFI